MESIFAERQYKLLTDPLDSSWEGPPGGGRSFVALTNVGLFARPKNPALVPDFILSMDVAFPTDLSKKEHRSYFIWMMGKPPDVVIEIVSDRRGGEDSLKMSDYAEMRIWYYVVFDPKNLLNKGVLRIFELTPTGYEPVQGTWLKTVGLGLTLWEGTFQGATGRWLRWCDREGKILLTGRERAEQERQGREAAEERLRRLEAQLRALGQQPGE